MKNNIDNLIKQSLRTKADEIALKENVLSDITNKIEKENNMKKTVFNVKRLAAIAAAAIVICSVGVIGAGKIASISTSSSHNDEIRHFPTKAEVKEITGIEPKFTEKLGDYDYDFAVPADTNEKDDNGNVIHNYKNMSFWYKTDNGILTLDTAPDLSPDDHSDYNYERIDYEGITLYYNSIKYKFVPPDYELTEEDKRLQANKELEISYGSQEVEYKNTSSVSWSEDGIKYCILNMDVDLSKDEIVDMAKEVIGSK